MIQKDQLPLSETYFRMAHQLARFVLTFAFFVVSACSLTTPRQHVHGHSSDFEPNAHPSSFCRKRSGHRFHAGIDSQHRLRVATGCGRHFCGPK